MGKHSASDLDSASGQDQIVLTMNSTRAHVYIELNGNEDEASFIEYHVNDNPETQSEITRFLMKANSLGYTTDDWLDITDVGNGYRRLWLVKMTATELWQMPDLTLTGYGPASGCMEAVRA